MPYIAIDLDAIETADLVARAARCDADAVLAGLVRLWRHCWREKVGVVEIDDLPAFFAGHTDALTKALDGRFIEVDDGEVRVKGADRYLRIYSAQSRGGHATKGNLMRGKSSGSPGEGAGEDPEETSGSSPAASRALQRAASSEHLQTINKEKKLPLSRKKRAQAAPNPRHAPLVERLCTLFSELTGSKYPFGGRDAKAVTQLLAMEANDEEISVRWQRALTHTGWPTVRSLQSLAMLWTYFASGRPATKGAATAADTDWSNYRDGDTARELGMTPAPPPQEPP